MFSQHEYAFDLLCKQEIFVVHQGLPFIVFVKNVKYVASMLDKDYCDIAFLMLVQ